MTKYNFDEIIPRKGTDSVKWDGMKEVWGHDDMISMWVADMDFRTPPFVMNALKKRMDQEVLGYTSPAADWAPAIVDWVARRHQWNIQPEWLTFVPGIVRAEAFVLLCFTHPGDKILVMSPVYHPFFLVPEHLDREVVRCPLDYKEGQYQLDFDRFAASIKGCKVLILCNPHNPGGRVWTPEELARMASIAKENHTLVISDEIHADLTLPPYKHHPFAAVSSEAAQNSITFMAPSKAFNMPGLASSYAIIQNQELHARFQQFMEAGEFCAGHMFAYDATVAAYREGEEWLQQMLAYVQGNIDFVEHYLNEQIPGISMIRPQASFLIFLDCRALNFSQKALNSLFADKAHLALNDGEMFGKEGRGFMRLNVGCPRSVLVQALEQLKEACASL